MLSLVKPVAVLGMLAMYALSSLINVNIGPEITKKNFIVIKEGGEWDYEVLIEGENRVVISEVDDENKIFIIITIKNKNNEIIKEIQPEYDKWHDFESKLNKEERKLIDLLIDISSKPGLLEDLSNKTTAKEKAKAMWFLNQPHVSFTETPTDIIFQLADNTKVTVGKDGKNGKIKIEPKKSFRVTYKRGEFDLEVTGEMDNAQMAYTEEVVRTLLKYTDERSFVKRVGYAVKDNVAKYLRRVRGKLAVD